MNQKKVLSPRSYTARIAVASYKRLQTTRLYDPAGQFPDPQCGIVLWREDGGASANNRRDQGLDRVARPTSTSITGQSNSLLQRGQVPVVTRSPSPNSASESRQFPAPTRAKFVWGNWPGYRFPLNLLLAADNIIFYSPGRRQ